MRNGPTVATEVPIAVIAARIEVLIAGVIAVPIEVRIGFQTVAVNGVRNG